MRRMSRKKREPKKRPVEEEDEEEEEEEEEWQNKKNDHSLLVSIFFPLFNGDVVFEQLARHVDDLLRATNAYAREPCHHLRAIVFMKQV